MACHRNMLKRNSKSEYSVGDDPEHNPQPPTYSICRLVMDLTPKFLKRDEDRGELQLFSSWEARY